MKLSKNKKKYLKQSCSEIEQKARVKHMLEAVRTQGLSSA